MLLTSRPLAMSNSPETSAFEMYPERVAFRDSPVVPPLVQVSFEGKNDPPTHPVSAQFNLVGDGVTEIP